MISKNFSYGSIDVDPEDGKIWVNCPNCLLRIQNVRFNKVEEKFVMIDINGEDVFMYPGSSPEDPYTVFLETIIPQMYQKLLGKKEEDVKFILEKITLMIAEELNK